MKNVSLHPKLQVTHVPVSLSLACYNGPCSNVWHIRMYSTVLESTSAVRYDRCRVYGIGTCPCLLEPLIGCAWATGMNLPPGGLWGALWTSQGSICIHTSGVLELLRASPVICRCVASWLMPHWGCDQTSLIGRSLPPSVYGEVQSCPCAKPAPATPTKADESETRYTTELALTGAKGHVM